VVKVSVIIPTYNRAHMLGEAIGSVLRQTFQDFEIIIVDDGSTDDSRELMAGFTDPRIKYIYQKNQGVVSAINTGIDASGGEYLSILGSDDMLLERALETFTNVLDANRDVAFVFGQAHLIDERGNFIKLRNPRPHSKSYISNGVDEIRYFIIHGNRISQTMALIRKSHCVDVGNYDPVFREGSEDYDLWIRLLKKHKASYVNEPVAKHRIHPHNITSTRDFSELEEKHLIIIDRIYNDISIGEKIIKVNEAYFYLYWRLSQQTSSKKLKSLYLSKSLRISPIKFLSPKRLPKVVSQLFRIYLPEDFLSILKE